jgi:hypothetical protein
MAVRQIDTAPGSTYLESNPEDTARTSTNALESVAFSMPLSTRVDNILLLLYVPGPGGQFNQPPLSLGQLTRLVLRLQEDDRLWMPRGRATRYQVSQEDLGLYSADLLDDLFALHALGGLGFGESGTDEVAGDHAELSRYFRALPDGERLYHEYEAFALGDLVLSEPMGVRLGAMLYETLTPDERQYLEGFKMTQLHPGSASLVRNERLAQEISRHPREGLRSAQTA